MTVTVIFGEAADGYLRSTNGHYTTCRAGSGVSVHTGVSGLVGQSTGYNMYQSFIRFTYSSVAATQAVTSAAVRVRITGVTSPSVTRNLEVRGFTWSGSGLGTADWRDPAALAASVLYGQAVSANTASGVTIRTGSDALRALIPIQNYVEFVLVTDRMRAGTGPTLDETMTVALAGPGTVEDPALVFTTVDRSRVFGTAGAMAQLSDETWVYLEHDGANVQLRHRDAVGTVTTIGALPIGGGATQFAAPVGAQSLALVADQSDNLYVVGRVGSADGTVIARAYTKGVGATWTGQAVRTAALPAHDAEINNVAAAYVPGVQDGVIAVVAARTAGWAMANGTADTSWVTLSRSTLLGNPGAIPLGAGEAASMMDMDSTPFPGPQNEVGSGLDVVPGPGPGHGYLTSYRRAQGPGDNLALGVGRFILDATGGTLSHASGSPGHGFGPKDASGKVRMLALTGGPLAQVTADADSGYGITVSIRQYSGLDIDPVPLGTVFLAEESIASMPDGPDVGSSLIWDAVYNVAENVVWIYYEDAATPGRIMRTGVSMDSYQANRLERLVTTLPAGGVAQAVRVSRGTAITNRTLVQVAYLAAGVTPTLASVVDTFNAPPTAPTLAPRSGLDATQAATFTWIFNDPNPGDGQTAYQMQAEDQAALGVAVIDTGKVASTASSRTVTGGTLANGKTYQWRVRAWDQLDEQSPWSDWATFPTLAGGTVTITDPATDNPPGFATDEVQVSWSVLGSVQAAYRVWLYRDATQVSDTGWVASTATTHLVTGMLTDVQHEIRVQVRNAALVTSAVTARLITPSFGTPEGPFISATPDSEGGYVAIQVTNPAPGEPGAGFVEHGFEPGDSLTGFVTSGATFALDTAQAWRGTGSGKMTAAGGTEAQTRAPVEPVVPGRRYTVRFWAYRPVAGDVSASLDWQGTSGYLSTNATAVALAASTWTLCRVTATAPADATGVAYGPTMAGPPSAGTIAYVDDLLLTAASDRPEVVSNEVYRRQSGTLSWELLGTCPQDSTYRDYTASSGVPYEYQVRGIG